MSIDREESTHAPSLRNVVSMDYLIILIVVLVVSAIVLAWLFVQWRRRRQTRRDDLLRVGDETEVDSVTASRRAEGKAAWTRISGGM
jgi:membrane protein implicated in regulation of membrane protease activity